MKERHARIVRDVKRVAALGHVGVRESARLLRLNVNTVMKYRRVVSALDGVLSDAEAIIKQGAQADVRMRSGRGW